MRDVARAAAFTQTKVLFVSLFISFSPSIKSCVEGHCSVFLLIAWKSPVQDRETRFSERAFGASTGKAQDRQIPYHFSCGKMRRVLPVDRTAIHLRVADPEGSPSSEMYGSELLFVAQGADIEPRSGASEREGGITREYGGVKNRLAGQRPYST